jgi:hypothetical protein
VERIGEASGIAAAVIFLAGLYGRWMNGGILRAEGELPIRILAVWLRIGDLYRAGVQHTHSWIAVLSLPSGHE